MTVVLPAFRRTQLRARWRPARRSFWLTAVFSIAACLVIVAVGMSFNDETIKVALGPRIAEVSWFEITVTAAAAAAVGALGAWLLASLLRRGLIVFAFLGALVCAVSLLAVTAATTPTGAITLAVVHVTASTIIVWINLIVQSRSTAAG